MFTIDTGAMKGARSFKFYKAELCISVLPSFYERPPNDMVKFLTIKVTRIEKIRHFFCFSNV